MDQSSAFAWTELARKVFEHAGRAMIAYLDNSAIPFAAFMPHFLRVRANVCVHFNRGGQLGKCLGM